MRAIQISALGVDAAEPATAAAADGTFYVAWVNHDAKQADVMLARFNHDGAMQGSPVRVNRRQGVATAWRGDQPSIAVAPDGSVCVLWTARVEAGSKHGTDIYLSVSNDRGQSFASEVKINDDMTANQNNAVALWQTSDTAETKMREPGNTGAALSVAAGAELPAGVFSNDKLFVAYIGKEKERRSIWLIRAE